MRQACTPPGAHPKANMCTPIKYYQHLSLLSIPNICSTPSTLAALLHTLAILPSTIKSAAPPPSNMIHRSNLQPCLRPSSSRHSCLFSHLFRIPIINSIPYSFHSQPSITSQPHFHIILNFAHTHSNSQLAHFPHTHEFTACSNA